jgi:hypothetical protein
LFLLSMFPFLLSVSFGHPKHKRLGEREKRREKRVSKSVCVREREREGVERKRERKRERKGESEGERERDAKALHLKFNVSKATTPSERNKGKQKVHFY